MNIAFRTRILIAASAVVVGLAASLSHAQTTTVNGVTCAANAVSLTFGTGGLIIQTGGCGVTPPPVSTSPPTISSVSPTSGALGDTVTISGANLGGATSVLIGGAPANPGNNSGTQIITTVPSSASVGLGNIVDNKCHPGCNLCVHRERATPGRSANHKFGVTRLGLGKHPRYD